MRYAVALGMLGLAEVLLGVLSLRYCEQIRSFQMVPGQVTSCRVETAKNGQRLLSFDYRFRVGRSEHVGTFAERVRNELYAERLLAEMTCNWAQAFPELHNIMVDVDSLWGREVISMRRGRVLKQVMAPFGIDLRLARQQYWCAFDGLGMPHAERIDSADPTGTLVVVRYDSTNPKHNTLRFPNTWRAHFAAGLGGTHLFIFLWAIVNSFVLKVGRTDAPQESRTGLPRLLKHTLAFACLAAFVCACRNSPLFTRDAGLAMLQAGTSHYIALLSIVGVCQWILIVRSPILHKFGSSRERETHRVAPDTETRVVLESNELGSEPSGTSVGIKGWLFLPAIGLVIGPVIGFIGLATGFASLEEAIDRGWDVYHLPYVIVNGALWLYLCRATMRFFGRHQDAPNIVIWFLASRAAASIGLFLLGILVIGTDESVMLSLLKSNNFIAQGIAAAIWIPYFKMSKRVRATFVN